MLLKHETIPINYTFQKEVYKCIKKLQVMYDYCKDEKVLERIKLYKQTIRSLRTYVNYTCYYKGLTHNMVVRADYPVLKYKLMVQENLKIKLAELRYVRKQEKYTNRVFQGNYYRLFGGVHKEPKMIISLGQQFARQHLQNLKKPTTGDNYVGVEIECYGALERDDLEKVLIDKKMHKWARTVRDQTIKPTEARPHAIELNFMFKESEADQSLKQVDEVLQAFNAEANNSCGLHVHLDARHRDPAIMFHNLVFFQDLLFKLNPSRIGNTYCQPAKTNDIALSEQTNHYAAISSYSYQKYRTIEVRIHQGTVDAKRIRMWVCILTKIANYPSKIGLENTTSGGLKDIPQVTDDELQFWGNVG